MTLKQAIATTICILLGLGGVVAAVFAGSPWSGSESTAEKEDVEESDAKTLNPATGEPALRCMTSTGKPVDVPRYSAGRRVGDLELNDVVRRCDSFSARRKAAPGVPAEMRGRANYASYIYGDCEAAADQGCTAPLEIQTFPACERHADSYERTPRGEDLPREHLTIGGHKAARFDDGERLEVYTEQATIVIFAHEPAMAHRAADVLRRESAPEDAVVVPCAAPES